MAVGHRGNPVDLVGKDLDGKPLSLASYRGKVVVVNVWNSGCAPCRAEAAGFEAVYRSDRSQGVQFLGIDTRDLQLPPAQQFVKAEGLTYPDFYDPDGSLLLQFPAGSVAPQSVPSTLNRQTVFRCPRICGFHIWLNLPTGPFRLLKKKSFISCLTRENLLL